jgi:hypothetical protein
MTGRPIRPEVRDRFRAVVTRAVARADAEIAEALARLRPAARLGPGEALRRAAGKRGRG